MNKTIKFLTTLLLLAVSVGAWAEEVTYTISSKNTLTTTGTAPAGSSATIMETYGTSCQMTKGNSQTLTLSGYDGCTITKVTLSMKSNSKGGGGSFSYSTNGGSSFTYVIGNSSTSGSNFSSSYWHGSWSTSYVDVDIKDDQGNLLTFDCGSSDVIIKIEATANSLYCQSYTLTYTNTSSDLADNDLALTGAPIALNFDLYNNDTPQVINYTTSSTGAVTVSGGEGYVTTSVNATNKTITVTPTAVTPSAQTITVNQAADDTYAAGSATFTVNITNSAPELPNHTWDLTTNSYTSSSNESVTWTSDYATMVINKANASTNANNYLGGSGTYTSTRFYKNSILTLTPTAGYGITSVEFTATTAGYASALESSTWDNATATVNSTTVTVTPTDGTAEFSATISGTCGFSAVKVYYEEVNPAAVATPTFSVAGGEYIDAQTVEITCATEGASIFYTIDGTDPTAESNPYTQAITISATTTLKAIAVKGEDVSNIATATYTFPLIYQTIAEFKTANTTGYLNMSGAQVVYIDSAKKNIYVRDNSGAVDIYNGGGFTTGIKTGDFLGGVLYGKYSPYKNLPEITNADLSHVTITGNEVVVAKVIEGTTEAIQANLCDLVKIQNTQIIESNNDYYVGENEDIKLYDKFNVGLTFETEMDVDVQGIASIYDTTYELFPRYAEDIVYLENSVPVSISSAGMATFCSDKALDFTAVDAIHAYYVNVDNSGNLTFTRIRKIPANTGVLLRNAQGEDQGAVAAINVPVLSGEAERVEGNAFMAVLEEIEHLASKADGFNNYILNKKDGRLGFYHANNQKVGAGKAYLRIDESIQARDFFGFNEGEATGIENVKHETTTNGRCYNLNGQQVSANYKGIVIVNGKKTIVK